MKIMIKITKYILPLLAFMIISACSNDDEPSSGSGSNGTSNGSLEKNLKEVINKVPKKWGCSYSDNRDTMKASTWSDYEFINTPMLYDVYYNINSSIYIIYGFESSKLMAVNISFPRDNNFDHQNFFKDYEYLGYASDNHVYLDNSNNLIYSYYRSLSSKLSAIIITPLE